MRLDRPCVEAVLYRHPAQDVVMLINYTGEYTDEPMAVRVRTDRPVRGVESLRRGRLEFDSRPGAVRFSLPVHRTDSVLIDHGE